MEILKISGRNIRSLQGDFSIDFQESGLKDVGLFAITGPTGSGKSSLLDTITLALYGQCPRTSETNRGQADIDGISASDSRNAMSRGSVDALAEVLFVNQGIHYRAIWSVRRARNKPEGNIQPAQRTVVNHDKDKVLADKIRDCDTWISEITGLDYEQFTRSIILAQGDFSAFLKAESKSRGALLESITGLDIYRKISQAAHEKGKDIQNEINAIDQQLEQISPPDDEEMKTMVLEVEKMKKQRKQYEINREKLRRQLDWYTELQQKKNAVNQAETEKNEADCEWQQNRHRIENLERALKAWNIRTEVEKKESAYNELLRIQKQIPDVQSKLESAREESQKIVQTVKNAENELAHVRENRDLMQPELQNAAEMDIRIKELTRGYAKEEQNCKNLHDNVVGEKARLEKEKSEWNLNKEKLSELDKQIENYAHLARLQENQKIVFSNIQELQKQYSRIKRLNDDLKRERNRSKKVDIEIQALNDTYARAEQKEVECQTALTSYQAELLRVQLVAGNPCPVCGSKDHPLHDLPKAPEKESEHNFEQLHGNWQRAKAEMKTLNENVMKQENNRAALQETIKNTENHLEEVTRARHEYSAKLDEFLSDYSAVWESLFEQDGPGFTQELKKRIENYEEMTIARSQLVQDNEEKNRNLIDAQKELDRVSQRYEECKTEKERVELELEKATEDRSRMLGGNKTDVVRNDLLNAVKLAEKNRDNAAKLSAELQIEVERLDTRVLSLKQQLDDIRVVYESACEKLSAALNRITMDEAEVRSTISKGAHWLENEQKNADRLKKIRENTLVVLETRRKDLALWQERDDKPDAEESDIRQKLDDLIALLDGFEQEYDAAMMALERGREHQRQYLELKKQRAHIMERGGVWQKLKQLIGSHDGSRFSRFAQRLTLEQLVELANARLRELAPRYRLFCPVEDSLDLAVRDRDLAGEERPVNTLSGGEGFLVSLALALGLAELSSRKTRIGTLFIDEGFGALDAVSLENVLQALESLGTNGRTVGIISHVPAIRERLTRQIRLEMTGSGKSRLLLV